MATVLVALDAVDVAMTEASVGAGISTVLLLAALHLVRGDEAKPFHRPWLPLVVSVAVGGVLVYGTLGSAGVLRSGGADPHARRAALPPGRGEGNRRAQRRHRGSRELPRLRHARRDDRRVHCRRRRHRAAPAAEAHRHRKAADEERPRPARHREAPHSVHAALRAVRAVPRRLRPRRRLPGRRHRRRRDHLLRADLRPAGGATRRARSPGRDDDRGRRADLRRRRRRRPAARRQLPRLLRARPRPGARPGARHLLGRGRRRWSRCRA